MPAKCPLILKVVKLASDIKNRLERLGDIKHRSKEAIIRHLEQEEYNEKLKQETLTRWQEVEKGKVVSHEAVTKLLDTWGEDKQSARPS